jgi:hypothetical protein
LPRIVSDVIVRGITDQRGQMPVAKAGAEPTTEKRRPRKVTTEPVTAEAMEVELAPEASNGNGNGRKVLSESHLAALAVGRDDSRIVRRYLDAMTIRPGNSRHRDPDFLRRKIKRLDDSIPEERDHLVRLSLIQQRLTAVRELEALGDEPEDLGELEEMFLAVAKRYSERKGISYQAWRTIGVTPDVLRRAGIPRTTQ